MTEEQEIKNKYINLSREMYDYIYGRFGLKTFIVFCAKKDDWAFGQISVCFGRDWTESKNAWNSTSEIKNKFKDNPLIKELSFCASSYYAHSLVSAPAGNVFKTVDENNIIFPFPNFYKMNYGE